MMMMRSGIRLGLYQRQSIARMTTATKLDPEQVVDHLDKYCNSMRILLALYVVRMTTMGVIMVVWVIGQVNYWSE